MPCVICKAETKKGFTYCEPCMKKDIETKRNEQDNDIKKRFDEEKRMRMMPNFNFDTPPKFNNDKKSMFDFDDKEMDIDIPIPPNPHEILRKKQHHDESKQDNKHSLLNEMKLITNKISHMEQMLKDSYSSIYVLVSRDMDQLVHLHGIYSNSDIGINNFKKLVNDADKYSKIIKLEKVFLYKTFMDNLDGSFDTALFDDCDMEIIMKKEFKYNENVNFRQN